MKRRLTEILRSWVLAFIYPRPVIGFFYLPRYFRHYWQYRAAIDRRVNTVVEMQPCLGDWTSHTPFDPHYFYQGAWLARQIAKHRTQKHVDISSSVMTIGVLSAFVETEFLDFRPLQTSLPGLATRAGNILHLPYEDDSISSLSCLHVIEHIGLGRYGDALDPDGSRKAAGELQRVLAKGGRLFLSLPVGRERVSFNAHRVHAPESVLHLFPGLQLEVFSCVNDNGIFHDNASPMMCAGMEYACGMYQFVKP